jgi:hypothetical protein
MRISFNTISTKENTEQLFRQPFFEILAILIFYTTFYGSTIKEQGFEKRNDKIRKKFRNETK